MTDFTDKASVNAWNHSIIEEFRANAGVVGGPFEGATPAPGCTAPWPSPASRG